jgi:hypothetical protein
MNSHESIRLWFTLFWDKPVYHRNQVRHCWYFLRPCSWENKALNHDMKGTVYRSCFQTNPYLYGLQLITDINQSQTGLFGQIWACFHMMSEWGSDYCTSNYYTSSESYIYILNISPLHLIEYLKSSKIIVSGNQRWQFSNSPSMFIPLLI